MAKLKLDSDTIAELERTSLFSGKVQLVQNVRSFIADSIELIDKNLLVISTGFRDWKESKKRIDILCVDKDANLVVIDFKETEDASYMELEAIRSSAMIANMTFKKAVKTYSKYLKETSPKKNAEEELLKFFGWDEKLEKDFGKDVKIILISLLADFSKELTIFILWLIERGIDIRCFRLKPQKDFDPPDIQQIIP